MRPIKKPFILTVIFLLFCISFIPMFAVNPVGASPSGEETFYFKNFLDFEGSSGYDSLGFISLSEQPSTSTNNSYYPPYPIDILSDISGNQEEFALWFGYLALSYMDELAGDDLPDDWMDMFGGMEIMFPNPLRIVESYEYQGNETLYIDGDVVFNLDFISNIESRIENEDQVKVSIYTMSYLPELIDSTNTTISQSTLSKISSQTVSIEDINVTLNPGTSLIFTIEMIPSNKSKTEILLKERPLLSSISSTFKDLVLNFLSQSSNSEIQNFIQFYDEFINLTSEYNFSKSDLTDAANALFCPSLVYDSKDHQASVTVPFSSSSNNDNSIRYYLDENNNLIEDTPSGEYKTIPISDTANSWNTPTFSRSKILESASATLYISHKDYNPFKSKMELKVSLMYNSNEVTHEIITLERTIPPSISLKAFHISFNDIPQDKELTYDGELSLDIQLANGSQIGNSIFRSLDLFYGGLEYKSSLSISLSETDHISVAHTSIPENTLILPNETVVYTLNISSEEQDDITIQKKDSENEDGFWDIIINPESLSIGSNDKKTVEVSLTSTKYSLDAYDQDPLIVEIEILGNTGYTTTVLQAEVSEGAVTYSTLISTPQKQEIQQGTNHTYTFNVTNNNTGLWPNSFIFTANSDNNFTVEVNPMYFNNLGVDNTTSIDVTVYVPNDIDIKSDIITFKVTSKENGDELFETINYTIVSPSISSNIFDFFESLSKDLGLDESFGDFAPFIIPILLIITIFIILIIMVFIFSSRVVSVSCSNRKKEILPDESATYPITINNRSSNNQTIDIDAYILTNGDKFSIRFDESPIVLNPKESKTVEFHIIPSDIIEPDDSVQVEVIINTLHQKKPKTLLLETMIKNGVSDLSIQDVSHWPSSFRQNDKVFTSLRVSNHGSTQTKHVKIKMFINGKEKNKVEDIIIPARGYAEIQIPWIAEKGKNDISLVVI